MAYELNGTIKVIGDTQTFASGFSKRELVVTTAEDRYPQDIKIDALKEKGDLLEAYKVGDSVKVFFDIRGREYNGRYYVDLSLWKLEGQGAGAAAPKSGGNEPEDTTDYSVDLEEPPF